MQLYVRCYLFYPSSFHYRFLNVFFCKTWSVNIIYEKDEKGLSYNKKKQQQKDKETLHTFYEVCEISTIS